MLAEDRPDDLREAYADALSRGPRWRERLEASLKRMPETEAILRALILLILLPFAAFRDGFWGGSTTHAPSAPFQPFYGGRRLHQAFDAAKQFASTAVRGVCIHFADIWMHRAEIGRMRLRLF